MESDKDPKDHNVSNQKHKQLEMYLMKKVACVVFASGQIWQTSEDLTVEEAISKTEVLDNTFKGTWPNFLCHVEKLVALWKEVGEWTSTTEWASTALDWIGLLDCEWIVEYNQNFLEHKVLVCPS